MTSSSLDYVTNNYDFIYDSVGIVTAKLGRKVDQDVLVLASG